MSPDIKKASVTASPPQLDQGWKVGIESDPTCPVLEATQAEGKGEGEATEKGKKGGYSTLNYGRERVHFPSSAHPFSIYKKSISPPFLWGSFLYTLRTIAIMSGLTLRRFKPS